MTGSEWRSGWSGRDEAEALLSICESLAEQCDAEALDQLDGVTVSTLVDDGADFPMRFGLEVTSGGSAYHPLDPVCALVRSVRDARVGYVG